MNCKSRYSKSYFSNYLTKYKFRVNKIENKTKSKICLTKFLGLEINTVYTPSTANYWYKLLDNHKREKKNAGNHYTSFKIVWWLKLVEKFIKLFLEVAI